MTDPLVGLREALTAAEHKLRLYRRAHSGEYIGGMAYGALMRKIDDALRELGRVQVNAAESPSSMLLKAAEGFHVTASGEIGKAVPAAPQDEGGGQR